MESLRIYIAAVAAVTVALFGALIAQSTGCFSRAGTAPGLSAGSAAAPRGDEVSSKSAPSRPRFAAEPGRAPAPAARALFRETDDDRMTDLAEQNRRLISANQALEERLSSILNWILVNFRGKFPLPEPLFARVKLAPMVDGALLNPELGQLLHVTHDEEDRLNDAFAFAFDYLREVETAILTVNHPKPDKVVLHIPTFREDGAFIREDLYDALEATLGQARFDRFLKVAEDGLKDTFYQFGEASRTMVFELAYVGNDPQPHLLIKDGYVVEIGPHARTVTAVESTVTNLPEKYAAYRAWLPDYVNAYAMD